ncbi:hypothetical protein MPTK1_4g04470 [Marchantia polymorpha subsp. ruderalis]|uniref:Aquaporin n=2 Tax=Marchantia polymorpha TaxID=3197 RepID=A0AAF6B6B6_MARPO|nr:hypothetical protein MARPO_0044s0026 [Marchantia polymorpha]BBN07550.1 hypothetical protein Mp_4g04470 [Marchantia polymorpha subsp. ruderalis]|eukprot:PTQ39550.1 hypothetical protein MARPO_0044s0026 [Marchantia polymorpha]
MAGVHQQTGGPYETDASNIKIEGVSAARTENRDYIEPEPHLMWTMDEFYIWAFYRAAIEEFIATLLFMYIGVSAAIGNGRTSPDEVGVLGVAWSFGATVFVLVYCTAGVSGEHLNPAVTLRKLLGRKISLPQAFMYILAQIAGQLCGAIIVKGLEKTLFQVLSGATNTVSADFSIVTCLAAEIIGTFLLVLFLMAINKKNVREKNTKMEEDRRESIVLLVRCPVLKKTSEKSDSNLETEQLNVRVLKLLLDQHTQLFIVIISQ